jgi:hypothetical protein
MAVTKWVDKGREASLWRWEVGFARVGKRATKGWKRTGKIRKKVLFNIL